MEPQLKTSISNKPMWKLGGCPRCRGDLHLSDEPEEVYKCLQCGYRELLDEPLVFTRAMWYGKPDEEANHV